MNGTAAVLITGTYTTQVSGCASEKEAILEGIERFKKANFGELLSAEYKDPEAEDLGDGNFRVSMGASGWYEPVIQDAANQNDLCEKVMEAAIYANFGELEDVDPDITDLLPEEPEDLFDEEELE